MTVAVPFWISIGVLSVVQGAVVGVARLPRAEEAPVAALARLRVASRWWALVPPLSVVLFVFGVRAAGGGTRVLTYLALVAVPPLAALALAFVGAGPRRFPRVARASLAAALFALAWADRGGLAGELAALVLSALSCVTLGALIAALTPPRALAAGIVAMAAADTALVVSDLLQAPNNALNLAHPAAGLPRLQSAAFGSAVMGYGDLFVAGLLGGLLALHATRTAQLRGAALAIAIALAFDLLFFAVGELPATVPIALALLIGAAWRRARRGHARGPAPPHARERSLGGTAPERA